MLNKFLEKCQELTKKNEPFAIAVVVRREEPSSGKVGDKAVINKSGQIIGWVGGGCVKSIIIKEAEDAMKSGKARLVRIGKTKSSVKQEGVMEYKMTCQSDGMVELFIEPVLPQPHMIVVGKTAIAKALVKLGKAAGYRVTAMSQDARPDTYEGPDELITQINWQQVKMTHSSFIVVATQGEQDEQSLETALQQEYAYLGFVASNKKKTAVFTYLLDKGADPKKLDTVKSPAGIDIQAKTPEEVAISILAEIIQTKYSNPVSPAFTTFNDSRAESGQPKFYINPVCGIPVDINHPKHVIDYKGDLVYFCCDGCKESFEKDPEKYMKKTTA
jgi:xanthine dehydrogenase accessory factor